MQEIRVLADEQEGSRMDRGRTALWLAYALTLSRVPLAVVLWLTYGNPFWTAGLIAAAAVTDALDGRVARWARQRAAAAPPSPRPATAGDWLDPVADKLFVLITLAAIYVHDRPSLVVIALIAARELVLVPLGVLYRILLAARAGAGRQFRAAPIGKAATVAQFVAVAALVAHSRFVPVLAIAAAVLGLAAAGTYVVRTVQLVAGTPRPPHRARITRLVPPKPDPSGTTREARTDARP